MDKIITSDFTFEDYTYLKKTSVLLLSELKFFYTPDQNTFKEYMNKYFLKSIKLSIFFRFGNPNVVYLTLEKECNFVIFENDTILYETHPNYKYLKAYIDKVNSLESVSKQNHEIFIPNITIHATISSETIMFLIRKNEFDEIKSILLKRYCEFISEEEDYGPKLIAKYLDEKENERFISYRTNGELFYKVIFYLFNKMKMYLLYEYDENKNIDDNIKYICFERYFCRNRNIDIL